jgi:hypothetical protein
VSIMPDSLRSLLDANKGASEAQAAPAATTQPQQPDMVPLDAELQRALDRANAVAGGASQPAAGGDAVSRYRGTLRDAARARFDALSPQEQEWRARRFYGEM